MADLVIILFHLKSDKFYCIRAMNKLKMICCDLFFCSCKIRYLFSCKEQKLNIIIVVVKKIAKYFIENKNVLKENARNLSEKKRSKKRIWKE